MTAIRFTLLGPVEVSADGRPLGGAPRHRALLAYLLLNAGSTVSVDRLIEAMWGPTPPETAKAQVQASVMAIRRLLRTAHSQGASPDVLQTRPGGYAAVTEPDQVDVHEFRRHAGGGRDGIRRALALWRGRPLADVQAEFVPAVRALLEEQRLTAVERLAELELEAGRHAALLDDLAVEVAGHPLRERLRGWYVLALHRSGRQAEALASARDYRTLLKEQQGLDPGREFEAVEEAVLRDDRRTAPRFLPYDVPDFTGRRADLEKLTARGSVPDGSGVVTIDGMAGIGKTTLAVHAAHLLADRFPDGALFVDLQAHTVGRTRLESAEALDALLRQLGVPAERIPPGAFERTALWRAELSGLRVLVILDNAADAQHVRPLLPGGTGNLVLITSRRRLTDLDGARAVSVDVPSEQEAAELFGGIVGPRAGEEPDAVAEVLRLCGHLPLAVRIAAARLSHRPRWTVRHLAERLRDEGRRLPELATAERGVAAAFALSCEQMGPRHRRTFSLLGLHPGQDFDAYAAAPLCGLTVAQAEPLLEDLLDVHMLIQQEPGRYTFHDLLRDHARSMVAREEDEESSEAALDRLYSHYARATGAACALEDLDRVLPIPPLPDPEHEPVPAPQLPPLPDRAAAAAWLDVELPVLLAVGSHAAERGRHSHAYFLSAALHPALEIRSCLPAGLRLLLLTLAAAQRAGDLRRTGRTLAYLAAVHHSLGDVVWTAKCAHEAITTGRAAGDPEAQAAAHHMLGHAMERDGDHPGALRHFQKSHVLFESAGNRAGSGMLLADLGDGYRRTGRFDLAHDHLERAKLINEEVRSRGGLWTTEMILGRVHSDEGDHDAARRALERACAISHELGPHTVAETLNALGTAARAAGDHGRALTDHGAALALAAKAQDLYETARAHLGLARSHRSLGRPAPSRTHAEEALHLLEGLGNPSAEEARALLD
ncbi:BTAD domain-containing putative transcriptional regulator [Streptomyces sp. NPDC102360]|uniref:AfsR/SARP family transcriptional regulator n=1 Tax=Streptomyces sp. NPDC102360 TaxID=3366160 RepID=UPI0038013391